MLLNRVRSCPAPPLLTPRVAEEPRSRHGTSSAGGVSGVVSGRSTAAASPETQVIGRLAVFDRLLPVWVLGAMALGIGLGRAVPSLNKHLNVIQVTSGTSLPIFVGLLVMMYPVLAKVRYGHLGSVTRDRKMLLSSLVLNWVVGPAVMFALAWLLLR